MADYKEEDLKKFREKELDRRSKITDKQRSLELEKKILNDFDPEIVELFEFDQKQLEQDQRALEIQLQASTSDIIAAQAAGFNVSTNMRYCNLYFEPMYDYPANTYADSIGGNSGQWDISLVTYALAPSVMIYAQTVAAPEYALVDQLILVEDITGDGYGFEETVNNFSTSTTTFNTSQGVTNTRVRLDRRMFSGDSCYSLGRDYKLTFASGHTETVEVHPPSPCWQSSALYCTSGSAVNTGIDHSYCSNEDYKSTYSAFKASSLSSGSNWGQIVTQTIPWNGTLQTATDTKFVNSAIPMGLLGDVTDLYFELSTNLGVNSPSKGDCAFDAQSTAGLTPSNYITGTTHYGSPLQINAAQWSKQTIAILGRKATIPSSGIVGTSSSTPYKYIHNPVTWFGAIQDPGFDSVPSPSSQQMMPAEGIYGIVRDYAYSENLEDCSIPPPVEIEVCNDNNSPSYYLTTELACDGSSITNYINGSNGAWTPIPGADACCDVDCSGFIMTGSSNDAGFGVNNGTITIDFTNGTGTPVGTYHTVSNQNAYDVSLTNSNGTAIVQNSNNVYNSGSTQTDSTCDTTNNSPLVNCNSNSTIAVGMSVTGTGVNGTKFVGAITGGVPGAVTQFSLSSSGISNVANNANATLTNTQLIFAIFPYQFQWGGLPPNTGGDFYTISVIDSDECEYTQVFVIGELDPIVGCTSSAAINYDSNNQSQCAPDCCIFCNAATGVTEDGSGSFLNNEFSVLTASVVPETTATASDGMVTINGGLDNSLIPYLAASMSYKYTIHALSSSGNFASAGGVIATDTSTLGQGITASFTSLDHGYYGVLVQIEDSSTGADAGLEKCFQWVSADVSANVCLDASATNYNTSVPANLQISNPSLCTYPVGCDCNFSLSYVQSNCGVIITANIGCDPLSNVSWRWIAPDGSVLAPSAQNNVASYTTDLNLAFLSGAYTFELTDQGGTGVCVTTNTINVIMPICGCTDSLAINYDPAATTDDGSCIYCVYGCTDPTATNYSAVATCDDGSCIFPYGGCTDPLASNYDAGASFDDGSCIYEGCLDNTALNYLYTCAGVYNPSINFNNPACCSYCVPPVMDIPVPVNATASAVTCNVSNPDGSCSITNISLPSGSTTWTWKVTSPLGLTVYQSNQLAVGATAQTQSNLNVGAYNWEAKDGLLCIDTGNFSIGTTPGNCGCTDPNAANYNPAAVIDDGSCLYPGCTDPNATNYDPAAIQDDGTCNYEIIPNPCQLTSKTKRKIDGKIFGCLTLKGAMYLRKIKIGYADDCSVMNQWKLILVNYLLHKSDLDCMFNCSDTMTSNTGAGAPSAFPNTNTTNYIDPFIRFMNEQCDKCTEDPDCLNQRFSRGGGGGGGMD